MEMTKTIELITKVKSGVYNPIPPSGVNSEVVSKYITDDFIQQKMYHSLVTNYIVNLRNNDEIDDKKLADLLELAGSPDGCEQIAHHVLANATISPEGVRSLTVVKEHRVRMQ